MTEMPDDPAAMWAKLKALEDQVKEQNKQLSQQNKQLAKTQLDLELSKEREQILKEQTQFDDKEAAQIEMMAQLKTLVKKVDEQEVKIEEGAKREEALREELSDTKILVTELKEEIRIKDEIIVDLKDRLSAYE